MAGAINFGLIDPNTSLKAANSFTEGQQEAQRNALAKLQLESAQGQNELARYGLAKARREDEMQNALATALQSGADPYSTLVKYGKIKEASELQKSGAETAKTKAETNVKNLELVKHFAGSIAANPTPEYATKTLDYLQQLSGMNLDNDRAQLAQLTSPEQIKRWALGHALKADEMLPKFTNIDTGAVTQFVSTDPVTGKPTITGELKNTVSPNAKLQADITMRRDDMVDSREKQRIEMAREDKTKAPVGYRYTTNGDLEKIPGGPADDKQQKLMNTDKVVLDNGIASLDRLATAANQVLNHKGLNGITGIKGAFPNVPGSEASNAESLLNTLKSQVGFGVLQDMRNNSKTGGALGNVSNKEIQYLQSNLASLEKAQSLKQFQDSLRNIIKYTDDAKSRLNNAYETKYGETKKTGNIFDQADAIINGGK